MHDLQLQATVRSSGPSSPPREGWLATRRRWPEVASIAYLDEIVDPGHTGGVVRSIFRFFALAPGFDAAAQRHRAAGGLDLDRVRINLRIALPSILDFGPDTVGTDRRFQFNFV